MTSLVSALIAGSIFAVGLILGGMTEPGKVVGFLDITGNWDPSLAFVMGGAMLIYGPVHRMVLKLRRPLAGTHFSMPTTSVITPRLLLGSVLFGIGWGIGGYCPGPVLASLGSMSSAALLFVPPMFIGFYLVGRYDENKKVRR